MINDFHSKLNFLSEVSNANELIQRTLIQFNTSLIGDLASSTSEYDLSQRVSYVIGEFLNINENQINPSDVPALKRLLKITNTLKAQYPLNEDLNLETAFKETSILEKIISVSIDNGIYKSKIILACKNYGVPLAEFERFMQKYDNRIDGIPNAIETPLIEAVFENNFAMVKILIELGADVDKAAGLNTPLILATYSNNLDMMILLKSFNADINKKDGNGYSPLMHAMQLNFSDLITFLKNSGADSKYAQECNRVITLSNIWGLNGTTTVIDSEGVNQTLSIEGEHRFAIMQNLSLYVNDFFKSEFRKKPESNPVILINKKSHVEIQEDKAIKIQEHIANASPLLPEITSQRLKKIKSGEPFVILGGYVTHAISMVFCQDLLIVFNRGEGRTTNAAEFFSLHASDITLEMLQELKGKFKNLEDFNFILRTNIDALCPYFEGGPDDLFPYLGGFDQKDQFNNNCGWANAKGAFGVLCRYYTNSEDGRDLYKAFTLYARKRAFDDYLKESDQINYEIIKKIKHKCEKKSDLELTPLCKEYLANIDLSRTRKRVRSNQ